MRNAIVQALIEANPKDARLYLPDSTSYSYKTGNPVIDYSLGYRVNVFGDNDEVTDTYASLGIAAGKQVCCIGKPSTGKTTWAVQTAAAIVRGVPNANVYHFDLEQGQIYTRIITLTRFKMSEIKNDGKYILKQGSYSISDIKKVIMQIYMEKVSDPNKYRYDTGKLDEFGNPIVLYVPTVVIIDSIPQLSTYVNLGEKKDRAKVEDVSSQADRMRVTGEISRFYGEIGPYQQEANIIVISINQIKKRGNMGVIPSPAEMMYLGQDETAPGGLAPQFLANQLLKFIAIGGEKKTVEEDGFDGFGAKIRVIKSRTSVNGQDIHVIYDKVHGFDSLRTSVEFARENGLLGGNRGGYYFPNLENGKEHKFTLKNMNEDFRNDRELYHMLYSQIIPILDARIPTINPDDNDIPEEELDY